MTGREEIAIVPLWPDPEQQRQRWAVTAESSWVAIDSASRRAQALGRTAEGVFQHSGEQAAKEALDRLGADLAELNAGLDELEVAAADSRIDLERRLASFPAESDEWRLYNLLRDSLGEALVIGKSSWFVAHLFMPDGVQPASHDDDHKA